MLWFFGFWFALWREKSCGGNYRKRSRPKECAGVERKGKGRDIERKRATEANREKQGDGSNETPLCVDGQTLSAYRETSHSYASDSRNSSDNDEEKFEGLSLHMSR
jgi:hypothetical protein